MRMEKWQEANKARNVAGNRLGLGLRMMVSLVIAGSNNAEA